MMIRKIEIGATYRNEVFSDWRLGVRLSAAGIDFYEQVALKKDQFA